MESLAQVPPKAAAIAATERRAAAIRRAYQRVLKRRPTTLEKHAMQRAALLTARAEAAAIDPGVTIDDLVRIENLAGRARDRLRDLIGAPGRRNDDLGALLGAGRG